MTQLCFGWQKLTVALRLQQRRRLESFISCPLSDRSVSEGDINNALKLGEPVTFWGVSGPEGVTLACMFPVSSSVFFYSVHRFCSLHQVTDPTVLL